MIRKLMFLSLLFVTTFVNAADSESPLSVTMDTLEGKEVNLADRYKGKVVLIVNVASKCGLTPQYKELEAMYEKYHDKGLEVAGFPCNQFRGQEPGTAAEISEFCTKTYGVKFDMYAKVDVNTETACKLYKTLTSSNTEPVGKGDISWNFEKFLIGRDGKIIARFSPRTKPDDKEIIAAVEAALAVK